MYHLKRVCAYKHGKERSFEPDLSKGAHLINWLTKKQVPGAGRSEMEGLDYIWHNLEDHSTSEYQAVMEVAVEQRINWK